MSKARLALLVTPITLLTLGVGAAAGLAGPGPASSRAPASASTHPVLVELFTSQGCSSCPAADAFVRELPRLGLGRDRVVPLTFHVDYWDGLGWKDPFAAPAFTRRQRDYATSGRLGTPNGEEGISGMYTPQMVVGGSVHFSGRRRETALAAIAQAGTETEPAVLSARATRDEETAHLTASLSASGRGGSAAPSGDQKTWRLFVAVALREAHTAVPHGENGGETLAEAAIVRWLSDPLPISATGGAVALDVPRPGGVPWKDVELVAFVQSAATRRVISARAVPVSPGTAPTTAARP